MKSGTVSIVGRPNVGKSTLLNNLLGKKIAITSSVSQTTRNIILGVYNDKDSQIAFVDTPGIHKPKNKLGNLLNKKAYLMTSDIDVILFMVDIYKGFGKGDKFILDKFAGSDIPVILLLNKVDQVKNKKELIQRIDEIKDLYDFKEIIPISALRSYNMNDLVKTLKKYLPEGERYYDSSFVTNQPNSMIVEERVREKLMRLTHDEIPHTVTTVLENFEEKDNIINMSVIIVVDRDNLKKIVIGKNGDMLKEVGTEARLDLEEYFGKKVYLELFVKTIKNWRDRDNYINELGLKKDLED